MLGGYKKRPAFKRAFPVTMMLAGLTGVEPATFAVTGRCSNQLRYNPSISRKNKKLAGLTGVEPATFAVTGRCSNQLRYNPSLCFQRNY